MLMLHTIDAPAIMITNLDTRQTDLARIASTSRRRPSSRWSTSSKMSILTSLCVRYPSNSVMKYYRQYNSLARPYWRRKTSWSCSATRPSWSGWSAVASVWAPRRMQACWHQPTCLELLSLTGWAFSSQTTLIWTTVTSAQNLRPRGQIRNQQWARRKSVSAADPT